MYYTIKNTEIKYSAALRHGSTLKNEIFLYLSEI